MSSKRDYNPETLSYKQSRCIDLAKLGSAFFDEISAKIDTIYK